MVEADVYKVVTMVEADVYKKVVMNMLFLML